MNVQIRQSPPKSAIGKNVPIEEPISRTKGKIIPPIRPETEPMATPFALKNSHEDFWQFCVEDFIFSDKDFSSRQFTNLIKRVWVARIDLSV